MILVLLALVAPAATPLTLEEAMDRASSAPVVQAARAEARASAADATTAWLGTVGPRIGGTLTTTSRTEEIAIDTPIGAFVQQPKDLADGGLRGSWPLLDLAGLAGRAPAAAAGSHAAEALAERTEEQARLDAAAAYLDVLRVDAALDALTEQRNALEARRDQADRLVQQGLAVEVDRLRLDVALADVQAARTRLEAQRTAAVRALSWRLGSDEPVEPDFVWARPTDPSPVEASLDQARERADLRALDAQRTALIRQQRGIWLEMMPTLGAWGQLTWTSNEALVENQWVEGGIEVTWTPVAGGTRASRARATAQRRRAVQQRLEDAERGLLAQVAAERAALVGALAEVEARQIAVARAREAERLLAARYAQGLAPISDVLEATASLADQRRSLEVARLDATEAEVRWQFARGTLR